MTRYWYTLTSSTPVSAGESDQRANVRRAHQVIPGATIRGALAAQWWRDKDSSDVRARRRFNDLFEGRLLVGQAVPDGYELLSTASKVCKYQPRADCEAFVLDTSIPESAGSDDSCPHCKGPLDGERGWRRRPGNRTTVVMSRTRGKLTERETAAEGDLFTRQAVGSPKGTTVFNGWLVVAEEDESELADRLRVGGGRSLDYGNSTFTREVKPWCRLPAAPEHIVRLCSPSIIVDKFGGPQVSLAALEGELRRVSGLQTLAVWAEPEWLRATSISGWHMRSRLPKVLDWAFEPGCVMRLQGLTDDGWQRLASGIGLRTLEGYGQVELLWPSTESARKADTAVEPTSTRSSITESVSICAADKPVVPRDAADPETPEAATPARELAPPPANDAENLGIQRLKALRPRIKRQKDWVTVKRELRGALSRLIDAADEREAALIRQNAQFPGLLAADQAAARAVLTIPSSHIPGTQQKLEAMK